MEDVKVSLLSRGLRAAPLACRGKGRGCRMFCRVWTALPCPGCPAPCVVHRPEGASEIEATNLLEVGVLAGGIIFAAHRHSSFPCHNTWNHVDAALVHSTQLIGQDVVLSYFLQLRHLPGQAISTSIQVLSSLHIYISLIC